GYAHGESEALMGKVLKEFRREDLVISTKIFWGSNGPNDTGLSRKHLLEGTKNSLKRLELNYVDLLFCHRPDLDTPIEETVFAMEILYGKYNHGIPQESRLSKEAWLIHNNFQELVEKVKKISKIAEELGCTTSQLAIAWCLKNPHVSSVITGATRVEQLLENL